LGQGNIIQTKAFTTKKVSPARSDREVTNSNNLHKSSANENKHNILCFVIHNTKSSRGGIFSSVSDPDPLGSGSTWIRIQLVAWIRIRIRNADPDPEGLKRAKYKKKKRS
jgi:hypothetical protein